MLSVLILGTRASGKTHLLRQCFKNLTEKPTDRETITEYVGDGFCPTIVESTPNSTNTPLVANFLAQRTVPAVVVAMSKSKPQPDQTQTLVQFAREHCPLAKIALVVTKSDLRATLDDHNFDTMVYDTMQAARGVQKLFYTSALQDRGTADLRCWVQDAVLGHTTGTDYDYFGEMNTERKKKKYRFRKQISRNCTVDTCDSCAVQ